MIKRIMPFCLIVLFLLGSVCAKVSDDILLTKKFIHPPGSKIGMFSPGIMVGKTLYVAGKGDHIPGGGHPKTFPEQARQCLENVRSTLKLANMDMENVVKAWVVLDDLENYDALNKVFWEYFPKNHPARTTLQVGKIPGDSHIEITAIAYGDLSEIEIIHPPDSPASNRPYSPGVLAGNTLYISGKGDQLPDGSHPATFEEQVRQALENVGSVLKAAGLDFQHVVWCNPYLDKYENSSEMNSVYSQYFEFGKTPARGTIFVDKIPGGSHIEITCIATTDLSSRKVIRPANMKPSPTASPGIMAGDILYLSAKSGFVPGNGIVAEDLEGQLHQTFQNLLDGLQEAGLGFENVVSANVYLRDLEDFERMNKIFRQYFSSGPPVRTTFQQNSGYEKNNALEQISLIAARTTN